MDPQVGSGQGIWSLHRRLCETNTFYDWCVGIVKIGTGGMIVVGLLLVARWHPRAFGARDSLVALLYGYVIALIAGLLGCASGMLESWLDARRWNRLAGIASGTAVVITLLACACTFATLLLSVALAIAFAKAGPSPF